MTIPLRPPTLINFFKPFQVLASESSSGSNEASHISSWLQEIQSREWEKRTKNKRTIGAWVSFKCKKRSYVTLHSLCICRLSLTCSFYEISTSHEECWLILTGLPSLILDYLMTTGLFCCPVSTANCHSASPFANCFLWVPLSNSSTHVPLPTSGLGRDLDSKPFVWFRAKTDKGIVCLADHPYSVTHMLWWGLMFSYLEKKIFLNWKVWLIIQTINKITLWRPCVFRICTFSYSQIYFQSAQTKNAKLIIFNKKLKTANLIRRNITPSLQEKI